MTHHLEALGWTLVHFCWQAAAIAVIYRLADLACARSRSHLRYVLALGALLAMLLASMITLGYEETRSVTAFSMPAAAPSQDITPSVAILPALSIAQPSVDVATRTPFQPAGIMFWLDLLWLIGVVSLASRTIGGWWMIRRLRSTALLPVAEPVRRSFEQVCRRLGISRPIGLFLSERVSGPLTIGMWRALVLLPVSAVTSLSPDQLEVVLAHELAHVRRADYLWNVVQTVVETLFFFHPAVWWIGRNLRQQRELCCDDIALESCSDPVIYASALLRLEEERRTRLHLAMALDGHQSHSGLRQRIGRMLGEAPLKQYPRELAPASLIGLCAALTLFVLPMPQVFASLHSKSDVDAQLRSMDNRHAALVAPTFLVGAPQEETATPVAPSARIEAFPAPAPAAAPKPAAHKLPCVPRLSKPVIASIAVAPSAVTIFAFAQDAAKAEEKSSSGNGSNPAMRSDYIDQMRSAGYDVDLDKYVAMKIQGITPEYARSMNLAGFGKPSADDLISMKVQGVEPDFVKKLHDMGITTTSYKDLVEYRIFNVTPEFLAGMKAAGFDAIPSKKLIELRVHDITPDFARKVKSQFPEANVHDLVQLRIFQIDDTFIASAKRHGFTPLTVDKLVKLRISGILDPTEP
jgi:beta-lactamase regulating signal transducer with metallopeptidase domain